jgi:uncharacterized membrane protein
MLRISARAIRWDSGVATELGTLGGNDSYALAINYSNVVVGGSVADTNHTGQVYGTPNAASAAQEK